MDPSLTPNVTRLRHRPGLFLVLLCGFVALVFVSTAPSLPIKARGPLMPPGDVYTCPWIAAHPVEAAEARVSCDPRFFAEVGSPTTALLGAFAPADSGTAWVPASGYVGQGVFAWTSYKYTNDWGWYAEASFPNDYTWYVQKPGDITKVYGRVFDDVPHNTGIISSNNHRWGAQNHVNGPRRWSVTWDVCLPGTCG